MASGFGDLDHCRQPGKPAADHDNFGNSHLQNTLSPEGTRRSTKEFSRATDRAFLCVPSCPLWFHYLMRAALCRVRLDPWLLPFVPPLRTEEGCHRCHANGDQGKCDHNANPAKPLARSRTHGDTPLRAEQVQTVSEMPRRCRDADHVKHPCPPVLKLSLHLDKP